MKKILGTADDFRRLYAFEPGRADDEEVDATPAGGQKPKHAFGLQRKCLVVSGLRWYRVRPLESTTIVLCNVALWAVLTVVWVVYTESGSALQNSAPLTAAVPELVVPNAILQLDPGEIAASLRRADGLIASGDIAAARLVLRRAAEGGDARAAMTLAETYDPAILEKLGVHGVVPDLAMARGWYEKAKRFGAKEATQRLELLANKQR